MWLAWLVSGEIFRLPQPLTSQSMSFLFSLNTLNSRELGTFYGTVKSKVHILQVCWLGNTTNKMAHLQESQRSFLFQMDFLFKENAYQKKIELDKLRCLHNLVWSNWVSLQHVCSTLPIRQIALLRSSRELGRRAWGYDRVRGQNWNLKFKQSKRDNRFSLSVVWAALVWRGRRFQPCLGFSGGPFRILDAKWFLHELGIIYSVLSLAVILFHT